MDRLQIDLDRMRNVGADLNAIATEFENANADSNRIADAVGHGGLADAVRSFAHSWDDTREDMIEGIRGMGEAATVIADAFLQTDIDLEGAFDEQPAPVTHGGMTAV